MATPKKTGPFATREELESNVRRLYGEGMTGNGIAIKLGISRDLASGILRADGRPARTIKPRSEFPSEYRPQLHKLNKIWPAPIEEIGK